MNTKAAFNRSTLSNNGVVIFIDNNMPYIIKKLLMH